MTDDDLRHITGRSAAFEVLIWSLVLTHPHREALVAAFRENSEIFTNHLLFEAPSEVYRESFEKARQQILGRMGVSE